MTAISSVNSNCAIAGLAGDASISSLAMAVFLARHESLTGDVRAQINQMQSCNEIKKQWNQKLMQLNLLMEAAAAQGKDGNDKAEIYVAAEEFPYKEYRVGRDENGNPVLEPVSKDEKNMLSADYETIYGPPGADPEAAAEELKGLERDLQRAQERVLKGGGLPIEERKRLAAEVSQLQAQVEAKKSNVVGYKLKINPNQIKSATENARTAIDSLNTDNEVAMLRLNDTFQKANLQLEQISKLLSGNNETSQKILGNF